MNFIKTWDDEQKRIEHLMECTKCNAPFSYVPFEEKRDFERRCKFLPTVSKIFNVSIDKVKELIPWNSYIMECEESELYEKYSYFKDIFGDSLLKIINLDHIAMPSYYRGFFSYKNKQVVLNKVEGLETLFNLGIEGVIRFLNYSSRYLYMTTERVKEYIVTLQEYLSISFDETLNIFITYPNIIEVSNGLTVSRVNRLRDYFSCEEDDIKNMYRIYPPALFFTPSYIDLALRFNDNRTPDIKNKILVYPWVIDCISKQDTNEYCGFSSLSRLLIVAEYLSNNFGKIVLVRKKNWGKYIIGVTYLLIKSKQDNYYLLCFGTRSRTEEKLLRAIFGDTKVPNTIIIQVINEQNIYNIEPYILNSFLSYGRGLKGKYLKNGTCIIELLYENLINLFSDIPSNCTLNENIEIEYAYPLILNEEYTVKHKAYYDSKKLKNDKNNKVKSMLESDMDFDEILDDLLLFDENTNYEEDLKEEFEEFIKSVFGTQEAFSNYFIKRFEF